MAISKIVDKSSQHESSIKDNVDYILRKGKLPQKSCAVIGPYPYSEITTKNIVEAFKKEREIWDKPDPQYIFGFVISFHEKEHHTVDELLDFGKEFCRRYLAGHQCVMAVHEDVSHMHIHIIENAVSYLNGKKEHISRSKCVEKTELINDMCRKRGWHIDEKGKHYDGTDIEPGEVAMCNNAKYNVIKEGADKSFMVDCAQKIMALKGMCESKEEFISKMEQLGWKVSWEDSWKYLLFENEKGNKVGGCKLGKTFNLNLRKEALENDFRRVGAERRNNENPDERISRKTEKDRDPGGTDEADAEKDRVSGGTGEGETENDIDYGIRDLIAEIEQSESDNDNAKSEIDDLRDSETESRNSYRERQLEEQRRLDAERRAREAEKRKYISYDPEL